jgi:hypothetical protein
MANDYFARCANFGKRNITLRDIDRHNHRQCVLCREPRFVADMTLL